MKKTNLFNLLGKPIPSNTDDSGTCATLAPSETHDDDTLLPPVMDYGTVVTRAVETHDDANLIDLL